MVEEKFRIECENMFGRNLERIEELEKWKLWVKTRVDYAVNAEQERKENRDVLRESMDLAESIITTITAIPDREEFNKYIRKIGELRERLDSTKKEIPSECLRTCCECQKIFESIELRKEHERIIHGLKFDIEKLPEPIDPCISCPDNDICEEECHLSKDAKKEYQKYEKAMREEEKDDYDNDAIRYKLSKMGIIIGRSDIYGIEETENYVKLQFQGTIEIKKEVLK